jgi:hypothetical protein
LGLDEKLILSLIFSLLLWPDMDRRVEEDNDKFTRWPFEPSYPQLLSRLDEKVITPVEKLGKLL